jgi:hypothetical protein
LAYARRFIWFLFADELELMLKDQSVPAPNKSSQSSLSPDSAQSLSPTYSSSGLANVTITAPSTFHAPSLGLPQGYQPSSVDFTGVAPFPKSFISVVDSPPDAVEVPTTPTLISDFPNESTSFLSHGFGYDVIWPAWPRDLPSPSLVRHL